ncbi:hypothetical protein FRB93_006082 [Tulasnella sp. JGI-2019a]|nr:hypothetical protein FRB93_006082 [Tulasnella sp. JGI-2019a]
MEEINPFCYVASSSPSPSFASQWDAHSASSVTTDRAVTPKPASTGRGTHERFLLIGAIPKKATDVQLKRAFHGLGDLLGIYVRFLSQDGVVILAFHDSRSCLQAHQDVPAMHWDLDGDDGALIEGGKLSSRLLSASALRGLIGSSSFIADAEARILVKAEAFVNGKVLKDVLSGYGDVCAFESAGLGGKLYSCEYFDARHAHAAVMGLHSNSSALGVPLQVTLQNPPLDPIPSQHYQRETHHQPPPQPHASISPAALTLETALMAFPSNDHHYRQEHGYFPPTPTSPQAVHVATSNKVQDDDEEDKVVMHVAERKSVMGVRRATRFVSFAAPPSPSLATPPQSKPIVTTSPSLLMDNQHEGAAAARPRVRRSSTGSAYVPGETTQFTLERFRAARASATPGVRVGVGASDFMTPVAVASTSPTLPRRSDMATPATPSAHKPALSSATARGMGLGLHCMGSLGGLGLKVKETSAGLSIVEDRTRRVQEVIKDDIHHQDEPQVQTYYETSSDPSHQCNPNPPYQTVNDNEDLFSPTGLTTPVNDLTPTGYHQYHYQQQYEHTPLHPSSASPYTLPAPNHPHAPWAQPFGGWRAISMGMGMPSPSPTGPTSPGMDPAMWIRRGSVPSLGGSYNKTPPYNSPRLQHSNFTNNNGGPPRHRDRSASYAPRTPNAPSNLRLPLNARMMNNTSNNNNNNRDSSSLGSYQPPSQTPTAFDTPAPRNAIDLDRIAAGLDTRTTVMIKNVPSRMTHEDMFAFVSRTCDREFDFLYLRMDFVTGNNVGYAFVNFMEVGSLLKFLRENLGKRWNMYQSEKTMYAAYATYQGKAALVTKFQNSSILDRDSDVQPHIYYSTGDMKGLPEPFPAPNDSARKARSMAAAQEHGLYSRMNLADRQKMSMSMTAKASSSSSPLASPTTPTSIRSRVSFDHSTTSSPLTPASGSTASTTSSGMPLRMPFYSRGRSSSSTRAVSYGRKSVASSDETAPPLAGF